MNRFIPNSAPTPRTLSQGSHAADFGKRVQCIKAARCPSLHNRQPAPSLRIALVMALAAIVSALAVLVLGWKAVGFVVLATGVILWCIGTILTRISEG